LFDDSELFYILVRVFFAVSIFGNVAVRTPKVMGVSGIHM